MNVKHCDHLATVRETKRNNDGDSDRTLDGLKKCKRSSGGPGLIFLRLPAKRLYSNVPSPSRNDATSASLEMCV